MNEIDPDKPQPDAEQEAPAPSAPIVSPGEMLREAREARGLSQAELAEAATLPLTTIVSLESDDFQVLNEPVYVRGYYRKCALTLEVDVDAMVGAYERKARPAAPALPDKIPVVAGGGVSIVRRLLRIVLMLLLLGLLVGAGWWLMQPPATTNGGALQEFSFSDEEDESIGQGAESTTPEAANGAADASTDTASDAERAADSAAAREAEARSLDTAPQTASDDSGAQAQDSAPAPAASDEPTLALRFEEASWLRVRDAADRTLRNELQEAGTRARIAGEPPLELFVGYAPGVEATWRGESVSFEGATRSNNTALVRLD